MILYAKGSVRKERLPNDGLIAHVKQGIVYELSNVMMPFIEWSPSVGETEITYLASIEMAPVWISVNNILPEDNWNKRCMIKFNDGFETESDGGTVHGSYRKLGNRHITHWRPM